MIPALTVVLAFCSIVYELLLGQAMAAMLGNTVLRYAVTIGLYMLAMGVGAFLARGRLLRSPLTTLQGVEIALTTLGGGSVLGLIALEASGVPRAVFVVAAHGLVVVIGILTGLEIPLLVELRSRKSADAETSVLGWDYVGAFAGTLAFAFLLYPRAGLVAASLGTAAMNAMAGVALSLERGKLPDGMGRRHGRLLAVQGGLLLLVGAGLLHAPELSERALALYMGAE